MEPDQISPDLQKTTSSQGVNKILVILLIIVALGSISFLVYQLLSNEKAPLEENNLNTSVPQSTTSQSFDQKNVQYKLAEIADLSKGVFEMASFPNAKFTLANIYRIEGLKLGGCQGSYPEEIEKIIRFAGCYSSAPQDGYSLIGIDIKVQNNGNGSVGGDIFIFGYFFQEEEETRFRIADLGAIPFSSYNFKPFSEGTAQLHFWIPSNIKEVYMIGGKEVKNYNPYTTTTSIDSNNFESKVLIDFTKGSVQKLGIQKTSSDQTSKSSPSMTDAEVKGKLAGVRAVAEVYYGNNGSYGLTTNSCNEGMFADQSVKNYVQKMADDKMLTCRSNGNSYAMTSILPEAKGWWCVDSFGSSYAKSQNLSLGDTSCN